LTVADIKDGFPATRALLLESEDAAQGDYEAPSKLHILSNAVADLNSPRSAAAASLAPPQFGG